MSHIATCKNKQFAKAGLAGSYLVHAEERRIPQMYSPQSWLLATLADLSARLILILSAWGGILLARWGWRMSSKRWQSEKSGWALAAITVGMFIFLLFFVAAVRPS